MISGKTILPQISVQQKSLCPSRTFSAKVRLVKKQSSLEENKHSTYSKNGKPKLNVSEHNNIAIAYGVLYQTTMYGWKSNTIIHIDESGSQNKYTQKQTN